MRHTTHEKVGFAVVVLLAVLALVTMLSAPAAAQAGFGIGLMTPLRDGPAWSSVNLELGWSLKLTKEPSWGLWATGFGVPESGNGQVGIALSGNLGEAASRAGIPLSDEFQGLLDRSFLGPAIATDKFDFTDWSHWSAGVAFRYVIPLD